MLFVENDLVLPVLYNEGFKCDAPGNLPGCFMGVHAKKQPLPQKQWLHEK